MTSKQAAEIAIFSKKGNGSILLGRYHLSYGKVTGSASFLSVAEGDYEK